MFEATGEARREGTVPWRRSHRSGNYCGNRNQANTQAGREQDQRTPTARVCASCVRAREATITWLIAGALSGLPSKDSVKVGACSRVWMRLQQGETRPLLSIIGLYYRALLRACSKARRESAPARRELIKSLHMHVHMQAHEMYDRFVARFPRVFVRACACTSALNSSSSSSPPHTRTLVHILSRAHTPARTSMSQGCYPPSHHMDVLHKAGSLQNLTRKAP